MRRFLVALIVDGSEILRSPVEGKVVYPIICRGFIHPNAGWEWDF